MALTITSLVRTNFGHKRAVLATITLDSSYPTGGYTLRPADVGLREINGMIAHGQTGYHLAYNTGTQRLQVYTTANTEVANTSNLSTHPGTALFIGI